VREDRVLQVKFSEGFFAKQPARSLIRDGGSTYILICQDRRAEFLSIDCRSTALREDHH
jgi:hypothetical protein